MIRHFLLATLAALLLFSTAHAQSTRFLTVLHLNDSHSNLLPGAPRDNTLRGTVGGIARAAQVISHERKGEQPVLTLHAGDAFIGDPMYNLLYDAPAELSLLSALGLDAMAVGNHEFDLTPDGLALALGNTLGSTPAFPLLSANLDLSATTPAVQALQQYIQPAMVKQYQGLTVGVFGLTTPSTNYFSQPAPVVVIEDVTVLMTIIGTQVASLRDQGCDVVICLSHMGFALDQLIATNIPGIDVIVGGHDHLALPAPVMVSNPGGTSTAIVQTVGRYRQIGRLRLKIHKGAVSVHAYDLIDLDSKVMEDAGVNAVVQGIAAGIEQYIPGLFSQQIAHCAGTLSEEARDLAQAGMHDTQVGNLVADAYAAATGADIGLQPGGSTAQPLYGGPVLPVDVFRMIGYGFNTVNALGYRVVTFDLTGLDLMIGIESTLADISGSDEMLLQVSSSLSYSYNPSQPVGSRLTGVLYNGVPINPSSVYRVATNELVPMFLDMLGIPYSNLSIFTGGGATGITEFELLTQYFATMGSIPATPPPGRITASVVPKTQGAAPTRSDALALRAYPNPMREEGSAVLTLRDNASVHVALYDLLGRPVLTLIDAPLQAGEHTLPLRFAGMRPGVYILIAQAAGMRQSQRVVHVR